MVKRIERLLDEIRDSPSSSGIKRIGDTISSYFIPGIIILSLGVLIHWTARGDFTTGIMRMLSVLLIACPCAFGIAAPLALWMGLAEAAKRGAIIRGASVLEILAKAKTIFFDKTGTLTTDFLTIKGIHCCDAIPENEILRVSASLESQSIHPLAVSILKEAKGQGVMLYDAAGVRAYPGRGIEGKIEGRSFYLGGRRWLELLGVSIPEVLLDSIEGSAGGTVRVFLAEGKRVLGCIVFDQTLRPGVGEVFDRLKSMGLRRVILTGDDKTGVETIRDILKPDDVRCGLLPEEKVKELRYRKGVSVMVGDGVNDAPALGASSVGIAVGCGTDLTKESARVHLIGEDLRLVPYLIQLSKRVRRKVYTNFFWAFSYNLIGVYLALTGVVTPLFALAAMLLSSLFVIGNSMRL